MKQPDDDEIRYESGRNDKGEAIFVVFVMIAIPGIPILYIVLSVLRFAEVI